MMNAVGRELLRNLWIAERFHERKRASVYVNCAIGTSVRGIKESLPFFVGSNGQPRVRGTRNDLIGNDRSLTLPLDDGVGDGSPGANRAVQRGKNEQSRARPGVCRYDEVSFVWTDVSHYAGRSALGSWRALCRRPNRHKQGNLYTAAGIQGGEPRAVVAEPERAHGQRRKTPGVDQVLRVSRRRNPWLIRG